MTRPKTVTVLVASPLEPEQAERIASADPRIRLLYAPELLPTPRYDGDHHGAPPSLSQAERQRWDDLVAAADVHYGFDFIGPGTLQYRAPRLRWVQATSSGVGRMLRSTGLVDTDILFTTAAGVHAHALSEFALLGLLYFTKNVPLLQAKQRARCWERFTFDTLKGKRALVIGLGAVGTEVAVRLASFGIEVWGMRRSAAPPPNGVLRMLQRDELFDALSQLDFLVLTVPETDQSTRMIGRRELAALDNDTVLVNLARGNAVDERALVDALRSGRLRGAVLDVFEEEPLPPSSPLWDLPNVLVSPHSASTTPGENVRITDLFLDNLRRYVNGKPLRNVYERERGY